MDVRGKKWIAGALVLALLAGAILLQVALDETAAGTPANIEQGGWSPERSLLNFLGGIRQFLAYELYNKTDDIHDAYYGSLNEPELVPYFRIITWLDPHFTRAYYIGSGILYDLKRPDEAISFSEEGLRNNPDSADLNYGTGGLYLAVGRYAEAIPLLEKALMEEPDQSDQLLTLSTLELAFEKTGQTQEAIATCDQIIQYLEFLLTQPELEQYFSNYRQGIQNYDQRKADLQQKL